MSQYKALSANAIDNPVLFLNIKAPRLEIAEIADHRLAAAKDLIGSIACMTIHNADGKSLTAVCQAAHLLLSDAYDLFHVATFDKQGGRHE
jgi:hypothetical protein